jgi:hypothetical protein
MKAREYEWLIEQFVTALSSAVEQGLEFPLHVAAVSANGSFAFATVRSDGTADIRDVSGALAVPFHLLVVDRGGKAAQMVTGLDS